LFYDSALDCSEKLYALCKTNFCVSTLTDVLIPVCQKLDPSRPFLYPINGNNSDTVFNKQFHSNIQDSDIYKLLFWAQQQRSPVMVLLLVDSHSLYLLHYMSALFGAVPGTKLFQSHQKIAGFTASAVTTDCFAEIFHEKLLSSGLFLHQPRDLVVRVVSL